MLCVSHCSHASYVIFFACFFFIFNEGERNLSPLSFFYNLQNFLPCYYPGLGQNLSTHVLEKFGGALTTGSDVIITSTKALLQFWVSLKTKNHGTLKIFIQYKNCLIKTKRTGVRCYYVILTHDTTVRKQEN